MRERRARKLVGVALAGGASRRMGQDKAGLRLGGSTLIERAVGKLGEVADEVLVADRGRGLAAGAVSIPDGPGKGPAAGILGAALARPGRDLLVLACDLPAVPVALLRRLTESIEEAAYVPRRSRGVEPLCARYRPASLSTLAEEVREGRLALHPIFSSGRFAVRYLEGPALAAFGSPAALFENLNTPEDLAHFQRISPAVE